MNSNSDLIIGTFLIIKIGVQELMESWEIFKSDWSEKHVSVI